MAALESMGWENQKWIWDAVSCPASRRFFGTEIRKSGAGNRTEMQPVFRVRFSTRVSVAISRPLLRIPYGRAILGPRPGTISMPVFQVAFWFDFRRHFSRFLSTNVWDAGSAAYSMAVQRNGPNWPWGVGTVHTGNSIWSAVEAEHFHWLERRPWSGVLARGQLPLRRFHLQCPQLGNAQVHSAETSRVRIVSHGLGFPHSPRGFHARVCKKIFVLSK